MCWGFLTRGVCDTIRFSHLSGIGQNEFGTAPRWRRTYGPSPLALAWQEYWVPKQPEINARYGAIHQNYEKINKKGKVLSYQNWSGKSIHQMAIEVDHEEAYDIFYAELSSLTHVDVRLANKFLRLGPDGMSWSSRPHEFDIDSVFRNAATFLACYLELLASQFNVWSKDDVEACWNIGYTLPVPL